MIRGRVQNGVVLLDDPGALREGAEVVVKELPKRGKTDKNAAASTVGPALAKLAGKAEGLPADAARNIDHYLYGHAKR